MSLKYFYNLGRSITTNRTSKIFRYVDFLQFQSPFRAKRLGLKCLLKNFMDESQYPFAYTPSRPKVMTNLTEQNSPTTVYLDIIVFI